MISKEDLLIQWKKDEKAFFQGWDFSYLDGRYDEGKLPWDYSSIAKVKVKKATSVLDMATGGGERFSDILSGSHPNKVVAIEGYKPNVSVAVKRLRKQGVKVLYANEAKKFPFKAAEFDVVLNRHGAVNVKEISRVSKHKGFFVTQQVHGLNLVDLMKEFGVKPKWRFNTLAKVKRQLQREGFIIHQAKEWKGDMTFRDVGALVYFLRSVPWIVDDFNVENCLPTLQRLQRRLEKKGKLTFSARRFLIVAQKK